MKSLKRDSLSQEEALSPRKSRQRRSGASENDPPVDSAKAASSRSRNRFGFKQRCAPVLISISGVSALKGATQVGSKVDLVSCVTEALGDLDAPLTLLRSKTTASQYDFKAKIAELSDQVKLLKQALSEQLKGGKRLAEVLGPMEIDLRARLQSLSEQHATQVEEVKRLQADLAGTQQRADERGRRVAELRSSNQSHKAAEFAASERATVQATRAQEAEDRLAACEAKLSRSEECVERLGVEARAHEETAATSARSLRDLEEQRGREAETAATELQSVRTAAQKQESSLRADLERETARAAELSRQLQQEQKTHAGLSKVHGELQEEHRSVLENFAAQRAKLESAEAQLMEKTSLLQQKDEDLRSSIQTVTQMQRDNVEQRERERQRVDSLEETSRLIKVREAELSESLRSSKEERERLQSELSASKSEARELQSSLQYATTERERLAIETAERFDAIKAMQLDCAKLEERLSSSQQSLASERASREAATEQVETLTKAKRELEVEYRSYQEHHGSSSQQQMAAISELKVTVDRLSNQVETKQSELGAQQGSYVAQQQHLHAVERKLRDAEAQRRELHNTIQVRSPQ